MTKLSSVDVEVELAGNPGRIVRAHVRARLAGNEAHVLQRLFGTASEISAVSQSLRGAMQVTFEREE